MKIAATVVVILAAIAVAVFANTSRSIPFTTLRYEADGDHDSGKVLVEVVQDKGGRISTARVVAFGREFPLPPERLQGRPRDGWAGIKVWQDSGILGRTLYVRLDSQQAYAFIQIEPDGVKRISIRDRENA